LKSGVVQEHLRKFLEGTDLMFSMHLGSEGSAQIGGLIATNTGGSCAFRHGMMQNLVRDFFGSPVINCVDEFESMSDLIVASC
jgi:FAD/FMN-containing dehydrogenase